MAKKKKSPTSAKAKKAPVKKAAVKSKAKPAAKAAPKAAAAKAVAPQSVSKIAKAVKKPRTKSDIVGVLAEGTGLTKKDVGLIFDALSDLITIDISKKGPGVFNMPGLLKIVRHQKPATKARKGINPFTGEAMVFKAKPARDVVKVRPLKALKEMVQG
jgi:nucleoid DNA-binding protein